MNMCFGYTKQMVEDLEDRKAFFSKIVTKWVIFIKEIIYVEKVILAHAANVPECHSFWWIIHKFFA